MYTPIKSLFSMPVIQWDAPAGQKLTVGFTYFWVATLSVTVIIVLAWWLWMFKQESRSRSRTHATEHNSKGSCCSSLLLIETYIFTWDSDVFKFLFIFARFLFGWLEACWYLYTLVLIFALARDFSTHACSVYFFVSTTREQGWTIAPCWRYCQQQSQL